MIMNDNNNHYKPVKPLIRTNTCILGNCPGGESRYKRNALNAHSDAVCWCFFLA